MKIRLLFLVPFLLGLSILGFAQDTVHVLQYNLLNFGITNSYCNSGNNKLSTKIAGIRTILNYAQPDLFSANEIGSDSVNYKTILDSILKPINPAFKSGRYSNASKADLMNMLYYNGDKLTMCAQTAISTDIRDIIGYKFYYNSSTLINGDTIFLFCFQAHLKAGNNASDASERAQETATIMDYINTHKIGANILLMGDLNLYTSSELAYQTLINNSNNAIRFYDPVYKTGSWSGNDIYSAYHTQSTRLTGNSCFAEGGLNDRFDFILCSYPLLAGTNKISYIPGSYKTIGQDGMHKNKSVTYGTNVSAPDSIISALYEVSDHLPVLLSLRIDAKIASVNENTDNEYIIYQSENNLSITTKNGKSKLLFVELFNLLGQNIYHTNNANGENVAHIPIGSFSKGIYLLKISDDQHKPVIKKIQVQ